MADENLEEMTKSGEEEMKKKGFWEKARDLAFFGAIAAGATVLGLATAGAAAPIIAGAVGAGRIAGGMIKGESFYESLCGGLLGYATLNTIVAPIIWLGNFTYPIIAGYGAQAATSLGITPAIGSAVAKGAWALGPYLMAFNAAFKTSEHLYSNYFNIEGLEKSLAKNWWKDWAQFALLFGPGLLLTAYGVHQIAGIPTFAWNAFPAIAIKTGVFGKEKKEKEEKQEAKYTMPYRSMAYAH